MISKRVSWLSIPGLSIILIYLNALLPTTVVLGIQVLVLACCFRHIRINYAFAVGLAAVFIQSYWAVMMGTDTFKLFLQQFISICITAMYWLTVVNEDNMTDYLVLYKQAAIFTAIVSIFQYIASLVGLSALATMSWLIPAQSRTPVGRSAAFLNEPSYCALVLFPIVFLGMYQYLGRYRAYRVIDLPLWEFLVVLAGFFFTGSSSGFFGVIVAVIIIVLEYGFHYKQILMIVAAVLCLDLVYTNVSFIHQRVNDSISLINGKGNLDSVNLSTQSLAVNKDIAVDSFQATHGLGGGLGSHPLSYDKFVGQYGRNIALQNNFDANSLMLRIISEVGVVGLIILAVFIWQCRFRGNKDPRLIRYKIISWMCLCYLFMRLFRFGHYFDCGLYMFIVMYYRCYTRSKRPSERAENTSN